MEETYIEITKSAKIKQTIYNLINEDYGENLNDKRKYFTNLDSKIQKLLDTHFIVPIVDDFLLYHKDNEKYEKQGEKTDMQKKKMRQKSNILLVKLILHQMYIKMKKKLENYSMCHYKIVMQF